MDDPQLQQIMKMLSDLMMKQELTHQALVGYNGKGGGLLDAVDELETRVKRLENRGWIVEAARYVVAGVAGLFGGRLGGN